MQVVRRAAVVVGACSLILGYGAGHAFGRVVTLHPTFRQSGFASWVLTGRRYAFIESFGGSPGYLGMLVDDQSGKRRRVSREGCQAQQTAPIDGPWLVFDCSQGAYGPKPALYSLAD